MRPSFPRPLLLLSLIALSAAAACGSTEPIGPTASGGTSGAGSGGHTGPSSGGATNGESGGSDSGGSTGASDGSGGGGSGGAASGGTGGSVGSCGPFRKAPGEARSLGFSGTDSQYSELYDQPCTVANDCEAPCAERGGVDWFCAAHVCVDSEPDYCLPPTKWRKVEQALSPTDDSLTSAETSLGTGNGPLQDRLVLQDFGFELPDAATISGFRVEVRRQGDDLTNVRDYSVRLLKSDVEVGTDSGTTDVWSAEWETAEYGGPTDLWGETWTPADINSPAFGVAVGALPDGPGRAYIDSASVTVFADCP